MSNSTQSVVFQRFCMSEPAGAFSGWLQDSDGKQCHVVHLFRPSKPCSASPHNPSHPSITSLTNISSQPRPQPLPNRPPTPRCLPTIRPRPLHLHLRNPPVHTLPKSRSPAPLNLHRLRRPIPTALPLPPHPSPRFKPNKSLPQLGQQATSSHPHNLGRLQQHRLHSPSTRPRLLHLLAIITPHAPRRRQRPQLPLLQISRRLASLRLPLPQHRSRTAIRCGKHNTSRNLPRRRARPRCPPTRRE